MTLGEALAKFWPLIAVQVALMIAALLDISKRKTLKVFSRSVWIVIVIIGELLGPLAYFLFGRSEE